MSTACFWGWKERDVAGMGETDDPLDGWLLASVVMCHQAGHGWGPWGADRA